KSKPSFLRATSCPRWFKLLTRPGAPGLRSMIDCEPQPHAALCCERKHRCFRFAAPPRGLAALADAYLGCCRGNSGALLLPRLEAFLVRRVFQCRSGADRLAQLPAPDVVAGSKHVALLSVAASVAPFRSQHFFRPQPVRGDFRCHAVDPLLDGQTLLRPAR